MMSLRRTLKWVAIAGAGLFVGLLSYLTFSELAWVEEKIESAVTEATGRQFQIEGTFELDALWTPSLVVEGVELPNAEWGSEPMMVEVGHVSGSVDLWSLLSGPILIEEVRLHDVEVLLEKNAEGEGNWEMIEPEEELPEEPEEEPSGEVEVPLVVEFAEVRNVSVTYREPGVPDRVLTIESLDLTANEELHLELDGVGRLNEYPLRFGGTVGPFGAIRAGNDILVDLDGSLGELEFGVEGNVATIEMLEGTNLHLLIGLDDVVPMVETLQLPLNVSGALHLEANLAAMGADSTLQATARIGEIGAEVSAQIGSQEIDFEAGVTDLSRIGAAIDVEGWPECPLSIAGGVTLLEETVELRDITLLVGEAEGHFTGQVARTSEATTEVTVDFAGQNLANVSSALPKIPFRVRAGVKKTPDQLLLEPAELTLADSRITAFLEIGQGEPMRVVGRVQSDRIDLTPFLGDLYQEAEAGERVAPEPVVESDEELTDDTPTTEWVFQDAPLPLESLEQFDVDLDLNIGEVTLQEQTLGELSILNLRGGVAVGDGKLAMNGWFESPAGGKAAARLSVAATGDQAEVSALVLARDLRLNILSAGVEDPSQRPPVDVTIDIEASGDSPRSLAESATGDILLTMGPGQVRSGALGMVSGDILAQLVNALNPFSKQEEFSQGDCVIIAVDIDDGFCDLSTVYVQGEKLTVVADGEVDLNTEKLKLEFNTKPRTGIGISADMIVTPFVRLTGTLAHPRVGLSKKGALLTGGAAVATGGLSLLAQGAFDRLSGGGDHCAERYEEAGPHPALSDLGVPVVN